MKQKTKKNVIKKTMKTKVYHLSRVKDRESIKKNGIIPFSKDFGRIKYEPRIFVSINIEDLAFDFVDYEDVDCWEFNVNKKQLKKDIFSSSKNHFYINKKITPSKIKLVATF